MYNLIEYLLASAILLFNNCKIHSQNEKNEHKTETEIDVPMDFSIKHPLQHSWTLWYYENDRSQSWEKNQKEIASFDTVEDFWRYFQSLLHMKQCVNIV